MIVLDANILIALLDPADPHHEGAVELLHANIGEGLSVSVLTLAEALVHPARAGRDDEASAVFDAIGVQVVPLTVDAGALARQRATARVRMPDAVVLRLAIDTSAAVATFDAALAAAAVDAGVEVVGAEPARR